MRENDSASTVAFHPSLSRRAVVFGPFRFDTVERTLARDGEELRLPPRALALLEYLIARPGRIVAKQELVDAVWKDAFVSESSLTEAIGLLRQTLGDSAAQAAYIQTVHRRGYRFVAPVQIETSAPAALTAVPHPADPAAAEGSDPSEAMAVPAPARARSSRWWLLAAAALVVAAGTAGIFWPRGTDAARVTRATITLPAHQAPAPGLASHAVAAISPDGTRIAYVAGSSGDYRLFLRATDQFEAVAIPGTEGGHGPFFSPDGQSLAFFRNERLVVVRLPNGQPIEIADEAGTGLGGYWHADGTIVYALGGSSGVRRVPAHGGAYTTVPVSGLNPASLRHPSITADGRFLLVTHWRRTVRHSEVVAIDLATGTPRTLATGVYPREIAPGVVGFIRNDDLVAVQLDAPGPEVTLLSGVMTGASGAGQFSVSADGTLLYLPAVPSRQFRQFRHVSFDGRETTLPVEPRGFVNFAVSPDGRRFAASVYEDGAADLWVGDFSRGTVDRLTTEGGAAGPVFSPDGQRIFFTIAPGGGPFRLHEVGADGTGLRALATAVVEAGPTAVLADGSLLIDRVVPGRGFDVERLLPDGSPKSFQSTPAGDSGARVSPDGRWVAYRSSRTGRSEIYIQSIDGRGPNRQVTTHGGVDPDWTADGQSIIFTNAPAVFELDISDDGEAIGTPREIYRSADLLLARAAPTGIVVLTALDERRPLVTMNLVVNWIAEARAGLVRAGIR